MMKEGEYNNFLDVTRIWHHEFARVISDRFFSLPELEVYDAMLREVSCKSISTTKALN